MLRDRILRIARGQSFTLALLAAVGAAAALPELGLSEGPLRAGLTTKIAVALIFAMQGLSMPTRQIAASAAKLRLHGFCQLANFALAPLLMLGFMAAFGGLMHPGLRLGFLYLSILPTTIASAIALTANSDGDSSSALFSTALSNVLGVFITPLLCAMLIEGASDAELSLANMIGKLALLVALPLLLGQALRPFARSWADRSRILFKRLSNGLIVFVVYAAFCESVQNGIWAEIGGRSVGATLAVALAFLLAFSALVWFAAPLAARDRPERVAAFFCGSHKTLATGVPMASVLFAHLQSESPLMLGLAILPLMCFHPMQLVLGGLLAPRLRAE